MWERQLRLGLRRSDGLRSVVIEVERVGKDLYCVGRRLRVGYRAEVRPAVALQDEAELEEGALLLGRREDLELLEHGERVGHLHDHGALHAAPRVDLVVCAQEDGLHKEVGEVAVLEPADHHCRVRLQDALVHSLCGRLL